MEQFKKDIQLGLSNVPKTLPSKYFYNKKGDKLFQEIMSMPEYYLTNAEFEIFSQKTKELIHLLNLDKERHFELIELGAGDGVKTIELLKELITQGFNFSYLPVDISANALAGLKEKLHIVLPTLDVRTKQGDYFEVLAGIKETKKPKVILFLGSNIGNMLDDKAKSFIYQLGKNVLPDDKLLLGVDLVKPKEVVLPAYNDKQGITKAFNLNLLDRINEELGADFNLDEFDHQPEYTEEEGIAKSFLVSKIHQVVTIKSMGKVFAFKAGEKIHTEISRKYNDAILNNIIKETDFKLKEKLTDTKGYFADYLLVRK
ncbi:L-histidine N(alpha)-methyltransferase [Putridiphycobacter roseus]|uniref:L-histidine N(Alpha)-methyltransferase n=1 Tax=Putridiphycobacter roseus TaxID=2219161 RepID=A0A2W1N0L8_9FLAO|nr:L-histidine N(alpha)-methyltransferase [Putridiphycobacter roseus]PZE16491.1 L-histidine N(alpha)-methyltransferase [Putridiphycobacter roseus]